MLTFHGCFTSEQPTRRQTPLGALRFRDSWDCQWNCATVVGVTSEHILHGTRTWFLVVMLPATGNYLRCHLACWPLWRGCALTCSCMCFSSGWHTCVLHAGSEATPFLLRNCEGSSYQRLQVKCAWANGCFWAIPFPESSCPRCLVKQLS